MHTPAKRKVTNATSPGISKRPKIAVPEYHLTPSRRDDTGEVVWPAPRAQIDLARARILECANSNKPTLILPDKDADGLSSGSILYHTLTTLGLSSDLISVHFPPKGSNIHDDTARAFVSSISPSYIFVLDQGSRRSRALASSLHKALVIDHHFAEEGGFPENSEFVTAHDCAPVATSSLLTYHLCLPLAQTLQDKISWLAALGTHGDLGTALKWDPPLPDMTAAFKQFTKKALNEAVSLINAPRRTAAYNVWDAWDALLSAPGPVSILQNRKLQEASMEVRKETKRWTRSPPKFSADSTIAVVTISSEAQVHPVIATRWSGHLKSDKLEIVMCANEGYLQGMVNFSCRVAKHARAREGEGKVDIIKTLESIAARSPDLRQRLGESFARGHKEASGGIVGIEEWKELKELMGVGVNGKKKGETASEGRNPKDGIENKKATQKNTLSNYFGKQPKIQSKSPQSRDTTHPDVIRKDLSEST
ncbi:hypothetical protein BCR34DRAFT_539741 [Clohesyomyces aquaticus]|uniref:DDH domain-containing protein n=1 Tax=Clohesyomyces aquaticus TaxID=1231657 RepID=A0A1Y1ZJ66_9PLEO|nr:hypothetical protein BCR34DRAFT_539741 [Clohesyomyces aquaticus]